MKVKNKLDIPYLSMAEDKELCSMNKSAVSSNFFEHTCVILFTSAG